MAESSASNILFEKLARSCIMLADKYPTVVSEFAMILVSSETTPDEKLTNLRKYILKIKAENTISGIREIPDFTDDILPEDDKNYLTSLSTKYIENSIPVFTKIMELVGVISAILLSNKSPEEKIKQIENVVLSA